MKYLFLILISVMFSLGVFAQHVQNKSYNILLSGLLKHSVNEIGAEQAHKDNDIIYLDAREKAEYSVSHIKDAIWVGYEDFDSSRLKQLAKNQKIVVYCSVGYRSEKITEKLNALGYNNVFNMVGGIFEWKNRGYIVVDSSGKPTEKIHAFSKTWGIWLNKGEKVY